MMEDETIVEENPLDQNEGQEEPEEMVVNPAVRRSSRTNKGVLPSRYSNVALAA